MKRICILFGSPRKQGNTRQLLDCFIDEAVSLGHEIVTYTLYDMDLKPCLACRHCQEDWTVFGCIRDDDMQQIFDAVLSCDLLLLATPIYSWYCTPPMKCVLDRLVYGMNKYYGEEIGPSLWQGKSLATLTTCAYGLENANELWEKGLIRYCKHSGLRYLGLHSARQRSYKETFMNEEKGAATRAFARRILAE